MIAEVKAQRLNATAGALLGLLHDGPLTGWELVALAQERIGDFWTLTQSQVYRELTAMAQAGLVTVGPPGPRDRKPHALTEAGREAFATWIDTEPASDQVRIPLLLTIAFARHLPKKRLAQMIAEHRAQHEHILAGYRTVHEQLTANGGLQNADPAQLATLEYGLLHEQAVLAWFDALPAIVGIRSGHST